MSKHETPMLEAYWREIGGTLIPEFLVVPASPPTVGPRRVDGLILPARETRKIPWTAIRANFSIEGEDVIVVQAKASRLGMAVMGQAVFSVELLRRFNPKSIKSVILCTIDDAVLRPLLARFPEVEVKVYPQFRKSVSLPDR